MSFSGERQIKATRKTHVCSGCNQIIGVGSEAIYWAGMTDGDFGDAYYHLDCREAECRLNELNHTYNGWDWFGLADHEWEDRPLLLAEFPAVAARLGIATLDHILDTGEVKWPDECPRT